MHSKKLKNKLYWVKGVMQAGSIISYLEMCIEENISGLQRGMNYRIKSSYSIILMSVRTGSPYDDAVLENGKIIVYEGHDIQKTEGIRNVKDFDQKLFHKSGLTQNGMFFTAAQDYKDGRSKPEIVKVYEKIKPGIWVYNGIFSLIDAWDETNNGRIVYKFKLKIIDSFDDIKLDNSKSLDHDRIIPSDVKLEVWKRDQGKCIMCGSVTNLHFDHIIPYSKGGSSLVSDNIQILCAKHNLQKRDKII